MTAPAKRHGPPAKYVSVRSAEILARCYPGMVPSAVIEEALTEKARREGKLARRTGGQP